MDNHSHSVSAASRRTFLKEVAGLAGAAALSAPGPAAAAASPRRPNMVFFLGEGLRWDEMSAMGNKVIHTPNLDRLIHQGVTFQNSFVVNALCLPSRATIMTGLYSHTTGAIDNRNRPIPQDVPLVSDLLRQAGYEIAFVGKSHVQGALRDRYWDYYFGFNGQADYYHPVIVEGKNGKYGEPKTYHGFVDDIIAEHAVRYLRQDHDKPFCLFLWFYSPHAPFYRSRDLLDLYNGVFIPKPSTFDADLEGYPGKPRGVVEAKNKIGTSEVINDDPRTLEEVVKNHYAGVVHNDRTVGQVLAVLEEKGIDDDTAILLSSDHGFFLGEWRFYDKRLMYEPSIRVPMTIRYPRLGRIGTRVQEMALNLDLAPTMLELAGVPVPKQMQGRSLLPLARGEKPEWRKDWVYEYYEFPEYESIRPHYGIRTERYKYIHYYFERDEYELYDLEQDPEEKHNLYGDPRYADLTQKLARRLAELRREYGDTGKYDVTAAYVAEGAKPGRTC